MDFQMIRFSELVPCAVTLCQPRTDLCFHATLVLWCGPALLCRLLQQQQPTRPPALPPRLPGLSFPLLRGAGRGHSGGKQIILKHFLKKKKFTLTYTDATTSSSHRLRAERGSFLGISDRSILEQNGYFMALFLKLKASLCCFCCASSV